MDRSARSQLNESMIRLADGDRAAFDPVYAALFPAVHAFCRRMIGAGADAEDAAQQALIKVFDRASTFDPEGDALTWTLTIAAWECRTVRKKRGRSKEAPAEEASAIALDAPSPEERLIDRDLAGAAEALLTTLSEADQATLRATVEGEAPDPSIAGATFRKRRERAFARLREAWRKVYGS